MLSAVRVTARHDVDPFSLSIGLICKNLFVSFECLHICTEPLSTAVAAGHEDISFILHEQSSLQDGTVSFEEYICCGNKSIMAGVELIKFNLLSSSIAGDWMAASSIRNSLLRLRNFSAMRS